VAKIVETNLIVKFSKIVKDNESAKQDILDADMLENLEQVIQEIVGSSIVVEIIEE